MAAAIAAGGRGPSPAPRPASRGARRNQPGVALGLSPCQRVFAGPDPLWLKFPALSPDQERRPLTPAEQQRLEQLATPRPESRQSERSASPTRKGPSFKPRIGRLWKMADWPEQICCHSKASANEVDSWFPQARDTVFSSIQNPKRMGHGQMLRTLRRCGHSETDLQICRHCRKRLCLDCWERVCEEHKERFLKEPTDVQVEVLMKELGLLRWQAKALIRNVVPAPDRLYTKVRPGTKAPVKKVNPKKADPEAIAKQAKHDELYAMLKAQQELLKLQQIQVRSATWARLTAPRPEREFPEIPYLPEMRETLRPVADLAAADVSTGVPLEEVLNKLQEERKIKEWQAGALLRVSVPVFERLYYDAATRARTPSPPPREREQSPSPRAASPRTAPASPGRGQ